MFLRVALVLRRQAFQEQSDSFSMYTHTLNGTDKIYLGVLDLKDCQFSGCPQTHLISHLQGELGSYPPLLKSE